MEQALIALVGALVALVTAFIWLMKFTTRKLFGKEGTGDRGIMGDLTKELRENTDAIRGLKAAQHEANQTLHELLEETRG